MGDFRRFFRRMQNKGGYMFYNRKQFRSLSRNRIPTNTSEKILQKYRTKCSEISKGVFRPKVRKNTMTSSESRRFFHSVLIHCSFPTFNLWLLYFSYSFSLPISHYCSSYIFSLHKTKENLTLITLGCEGRLPMARFAPSPVPLSSCCSPSAEIDKNG